MLISDPIPALDLCKNFMPGNGTVGWIMALSTTHTGGSSMWNADRSENGEISCHERLSTKGVVRERSRPSREELLYRAMTALVAMSLLATTL